MPGRRVKGLVCRRKLPRGKTRSRIGLLHPGKVKKFNRTGMRDMSWADRRDDIVGEVGGSQIVENHIVFCPAYDEAPLKAPRGQSHNPDLRKVFSGSGVVLPTAVR